MSDVARESSCGENWRPPIARRRVQPNGPTGPQKVTRENPGQAPTALQRSVQWARWPSAFCLRVTPPRLPRPHRAFQGLLDLFLVRRRLVLLWFLFGSRSVLRSYIPRLDIIVNLILVIVRFITNLMLSSTGLCQIFAVIPKHRAQHAANNAMQYGRRYLGYRDPR